MMCLWSRENESRRAKQGDSLVVSMLSNFHGDRVKVAALSVAEGDIVCACFSCGDKVRFSGLSREFQKLYSVPADAIAVFTEVTSPGGITYDAFDFQNGEIAPMRVITKGAKITVLELVGQRTADESEHTAARTFSSPRIMGKVEVGVLTLLLALVGYMSMTA